MFIMSSYDRLDGEVLRPASALGCGAMGDDCGPPR
jgi:hypothetical protein